MPDIFDKVASQTQELKGDVFDEVIRKSPDLIKQKTEIPKSILKGAIKEISKYPQKIYEFTTGKTFLDPLAKALGLEKKQDLMKTQVTEPLEQFISRTLEKKAPSTEETRPYEEFGARYIQQAPFNPLLALLTAGAGQITKELGGGPIAQTVAELGTGGLAGFAKNLAKKGIIPPKNLKDLYNFGKTIGLSDNEITPLIQSERKIKWLSTLSQKGKRTNEALKASKEALGDAFETIIKSKEAIKSLTPNQAVKFANHVKKITSKMPVELREKLQKDAFELAKNGFKGSELMNFWKDINFQIAQGNKELGLLKEPISNALKDISPNLGESFVKINNLYSRYYNIVKALKPSIYTQLETGGKALFLLKSLIFFNPKALAGAGIYQGAKSLARETLINPKFQGLTKKLIQSLNTNKYSSANIIFQKMNEMIKKDDPKIAKELKSVNFEDLTKD